MLGGLMSENQSAQHYTCGSRFMGRIRSVSLAHHQGAHRNTCLP